MRSFCVRRDVFCVLAALPVLELAAGCASQHSPRNGQQVCGGDASVAFSGNPALSQCEVNTFLAAQQAGGWSGDAVVSGTRPCP